MRRLPGVVSCTISGIIDNVIPLWNRDDRKYTLLYAVSHDSHVSCVELGIGALDGIVSRRDLGSERGKCRTLCMNSRAFKAITLTVRLRCYIP